MLTASVVTYHTSLPEISAVLDCALQSPIDKLYIIDNSRNDALRILERRSPKIRYIHNANIGYGGAHNLAIRSDGTGCEISHRSESGHPVFAGNNRITYVLYGSQ